MQPKFYWYQKVRIVNGFYRNTERDICGTKKILWFERQYKVSIYYGEYEWIKESDLTEVGK